MDRLSKLNEEICSLRLKLENLMLSGESDSAAILEISKKLDNLIIEYYAEKKLDKQPTS